MAEMTPESVAAEVEAFVSSTWDPDMTVGDWWQALLDGRWSHPSLPEHAYGRGFSLGLSLTAMRTLGRLDVIGPPPGLGYMLAAPTIAEHGTQEQIDHYVPRILNGTDAWCQLFSEPGAGSDLAGLQTKAELDGEEWAVTGQKVWTSGGRIADMGMLIARTDPDAPKHAGISYFAIDMHQEAVDVRPLKEMTGRSMFNEVFMSEARVPADAQLGGLGDGWRVANTTLTHERASIGGGSAGFVLVNPGSIADNLARRAGDVVSAARGGSNAGHAPGVGQKLYDRYTNKARELGRTTDPVFRQQSIELYSLLQLNRWNIQRAKDKRQRTGAEPNIAKLMDAEIHRRFREYGIATAGADAMLGYKSSQVDASISEVALFASAPSIYGGSDEVQHNIIGERVLGLPKEPGPDRDTPFRELPKNQ
jgi:alkylation response protein AidB-like acyl-CoA dehydrogenase